MYTHTKHTYIHTHATKIPTDQYTQNIAIWLPTVIGIANSYKVIWQVIAVYITHLCINCYMTSL